MQISFTRNYLNLSNEGGKMYLYWKEFYSAFIPQTFAFHYCCICIELRDVASALKYSNEKWNFVISEFGFPLWMITLYERLGVPEDDFILYLFSLENTIWINICLRKVLTKSELHLIEIDWLVYFWNGMIIEGFNKIWAY
jgi:hypothetical protein